MTLIRPYTVFILENGDLMYAHYRATVSSQTTDYLQVKTSSDLMNMISMQIKVFNSGPVLTRVWENPTVTDGTTSLNNTTDGVVANLNRNETQLPNASFYTDPTGVSGGDLILVDPIVGDGDVHRNGLENGPYPQFILKASSDYLFEFENTGANDVDFHTTFVFYEQTL